MTDHWYLNRNKYVLIEIEKIKCFLVCFVSLTSHLTLDNKESISLPLPISSFYEWMWNNFLRFFYLTYLFCYLFVCFSLFRVYLCRTWYHNDIVLIGVVALWNSVTLFFILLVIFNVQWQYFTWALARCAAFIFSYIGNVVCLFVTRRVYWSFVESNVSWQQQDHNPISMDIMRLIQLLAFLLQK